MTVNLSAPAMARLRSMASTGSYHGREIEPELMRQGLVRIHTRHREGSRWDLTERGREVLASLED